MISSILLAIVTADPANGVDPKTAANVVPPITFVVTALFAVAVILLGFDLVRRVRRAQFRAEIQEKLAAEIAEQQGNAASAEADDAGDTGDTAAPTNGDPQA